MKRIFLVVLIASLLLIAIGSGGLFLRNYQFDEGWRALKADQGPLALNRLKPLAEVGDKSAQITVGMIYAYGLGGVPKSDKNAVYWFRRSGPMLKNKGDKAADPAASLELDVAKTFATGDQGVKVDKAESVKWLKLAASGGSKEASILLAHSPSR